MVMSTSQNLLHSEVGPLVKCYLVCDSMYDSVILLASGWWCWLKLCQQERQTHNQNKYLFLQECITDSLRLKGTHCSQLATVWPVGFLKE